MRLTPTIEKVWENHDFKMSYLIWSAITLELGGVQTPMNRLLGAMVMSVHGIIRLMKLSHWTNAFSVEQYTGYVVIPQYWFLISSNI